MKDLYTLTHPLIDPVDAGILFGIVLLVLSYFIVLLKEVKDMDWSERTKPVVTVYKAKEWDFVRRSYRNVVFRSAVCGVCGNPVTPYHQRYACTYCNHAIDWGRLKGTRLKFRNKITRKLKSVEKLTEGEP